MANPYGRFVSPDDHGYVAYAVIKYCVNLSSVMNSYRT
jgi:hypothetical protein